MWKEKKLIGIVVWNYV